MYLLPALFGILFFNRITSGKQGFGPGDQEWGYIDVRPGAHMFWWLYLTPNTSTHNYDQKPLLIWLQGGPGFSGSGYGNFQEFGVLDIHKKSRNYTWVKDYNILFLDSPVGVGFSYVDEEDHYPRSDSQVVEDLMKLMKEFLIQHPVFRKVDIYIAAQSYGGKTAVKWALQWSKDRDMHQDKNGREIQSNLKGVLLGNSWISPIDSVMAWAPYLLHTGVIDSRIFKTIQNFANKTKSAVNGNKWMEAWSFWETTRRLITATTHGIDFYNILAKVRRRAESRDSSAQFPSQISTLSPETILTSSELRQKFRNNLKGLPGSDATDDLILTSLMNNEVRPALNISRPWKSFNEDIFFLLAIDFMKPATNAVEELLNETKLKVFVHSGQLDLTVPTVGTMEWTTRMQWRNATHWLLSDRSALIVNDTVEGFYQSYQNFDFYWVSRAGHDVPADNPAAMAEILRRLTQK